AHHPGEQQADVALDAQVAVRVHAAIREAQASPRGGEEIEFGQDVATGQVDDDGLGEVPQCQQVVDLVGTRVEAAQHHELTAQLAGQRDGVVEVDRGGPGGGDDNSVERGLDSGGRVREKPEVGRELLASPR